MDLVCTVEEVRKSKKRDKDKGFIPTYTRGKRASAGNQFGIQGVLFVPVVSRVSTSPAHPPAASQMSSWKNGKIAVVLMCKLSREAWMPRSTR